MSDKWLQAETLPRGGLWRRLFGINRLDRIQTDIKSLTERLDVIDVQLSRLAVARETDIKSLTERLDVIDAQLSRLAVALEGSGHAKEDREKFGSMIDEMERVQIRSLANSEGIQRTTDMLVTSIARINEMLADLKEPVEAKARFRAPLVDATINLRMAPGELVDRLSILEIKLDRIVDPAKRANVQVEHVGVRSVFDAALGGRDDMAGFLTALRDINGRIWDLEDKIRDFERRKDFGDGFVEVARNIYATNDERARLKREVNIRCASDLVEEKSYTPY
jgi:hypothetical protein